MKNLLPITCVLLFSPFLLLGQSAVKTAEVDNKEYPEFTYSGEVNEDGEPHGNGKAIYLDGDIYEGQFLFGDRHGKGLYNYFQGDVYNGNWNKNQRHGYGEYFWAKSGTVYKGNWINNLMEGEGQRILKDGTSQNGNYVKGKKNGAFIYVHPDGNWTRITFENGKKVDESEVMPPPNPLDIDPNAVAEKPEPIAKPIEKPNEEEIKEPEPSPEVKPIVVTKPEPKPQTNKTVDEIWFEALGSPKGSKAANLAIEQYGVPDRINSGDEMLQRKNKSIIVPFHKKGVRFHFHDTSPQKLKMVSFFGSTGIENVQYNELLPFGFKLSDTREDLNAKFSSMITQKTGKGFIDYLIKPDPINFPKVTLKVVYVNSLPEPVIVELHYK
ncbi:MAG: hypothetical protein AAF502_24860 [Bacteroidota bacterium]